LLPSKFTFPYAENIVIIEVASEKSHQSVKKYCDQTKRDVNRKGLTMTNLLSINSGKAKVEKLNIRLKSASS